MQLSQIFYTKKSKYLVVLMLISIIAVICVAFSITGNDDFDLARREALLRKIGHEVLLQSGDSSSRVLPIKKITANEYQISFEKEITFLTDSLLNTTQRLLAKDPLAQDYVVNVMNCNSTNVAYGFAISNNKKNDIVACQGRAQPIACYLINIKFKPTGIPTVGYTYLFAGVSLLSFIGLIFLKSAKPLKTSTLDKDAKKFTLGSVLFDVQQRQLIINEKTIDLTGTETRLLHIFALSPNKTIERSQLQKEIWEDEGIIVGRSLDMFISKLRKKLELDPNINIVVIRSKGYKLEVST